MFIVLETLFLIAMVAIILDQIVIPAYQNRPLFPAFREQKLQDEIQELNQEVREKELKTQATSLKRELKKGSK